MSFVTLLLQSILGAALLLMAMAAALKARWLRWLAPSVPQDGLARVIAAAGFTVAGLTTWLGAAVPFIAFFASCIALFASAYPFFGRATARRLPARSWLFAAMGAAAVAIALAQPLGLRVMALPKAAELPYKAVPSRVVKTYDEGLGFEGVAAAADGTLFMSANRDLDFSRHDYYRHAHGEVLARRQDGEEHVLFRTPQGSTAGVIAIAADGSLYLTSHGDVPAIWHVRLDGGADKLLDLPAGAWPNGLDIGPDGLLYSPDSALGLVWQIDPVTRSVHRVLEVEDLKARPFISLAPGANGLHFRGRDMYVTVSDRTTVLAFRLDASGNFGAPRIVASGIPGDDFAIGRDGSLFITTHPYDTLVRVAPDGARTIVGKAREHIVGATDATFGKRPDDQDTLYVVTDGGAFTGGAKSRGELVALHPDGTH